MYVSFFWLTDQIFYSSSSPLFSSTFNSSSIGAFVFSTEANSFGLTLAFSRERPCQTKSTASSSSASSPISSSSNMPHRPTPSLLAPHLHTQHPNPHSHYLPGGTGLSPHSPPTEGDGIAGSAFSPTTPPASCDSSSNANLGQISPQTTTKIDHPLVTSMKKESSHDLVGGGRRNIESQKGNVKDIKKDHERGILDDKRQSFNSLKSFDRMKRKRGSSSGSSSISSPPHSPPEHCIGLSPSSTKQSSNISSSSPLRIRRKASSPSSLEDLDGLYMVKSQQNNKRNGMVLVSAMSSNVPLLRFETDTGLV